MGRNLYHDEKMCFALTRITGSSAGTGRVLIDKTKETLAQETCCSPKNTINIPLDRPFPALTKEITTPEATRNGMTHLASPFTCYMLKRNTAVANFGTKRGNLAVIVFTADWSKCLSGGYGDEGKERSEVHGFWYHPVLILCQSCVV